MAEQRILMVCMGNICRSPTAEGVLRSKLKAAGLDRAIEVDSAGTHGHFHQGQAPDARAVKHAAARGYDLAKLRARPLTERDFQRFEWIFAMDEDNLEHLLSKRPQGNSARIGLLLDFAQRFRGERVVPDPYYGPPAGFDRALDLIEDACDGLLRVLQAARNFPGKD